MPPVESNRILQIISMTRPIVSVAFMVFYEEGYLLLIDSVSKYLPQFKQVKVSENANTGNDGATEPPHSEITIAQLLRHNAYFSDGLGSTKLESDYQDEPYKNIERRLNMMIETLPLF
jgi:CubicO group peptidase (beta-lactamase class C family)